MSNPVLERGTAALNFARQALLEFLEDIPEDKLTHQPCVAGNHALWIAGHLAWADDYFMTHVGDKPARCPESLGKLFGMGSTPQSDAATYPSLNEIKNSLADNREALLAWFGSMSADDLNKPLPSDYQSFAADFGMMMTSIAWHEGMHLGQLTVVRKSLGMAPKIG